MRLSSLAPVLSLAAVALCACTTASGVNGGSLAGFSGALPGTPCTPAVQAEGCLLGAGGAQSRMQCTASGWALLEVCNGGTVCVEQPQPGAPARKFTQCQVSGASTDTISGADGSAADATFGNDAIPGSDAGGSSDGDGTGAVGQDADTGAGATDAQSYDGGFDTWGEDDAAAYDVGSNDGYSYDSGAYDGYSYDSGAYDGYSYDSGAYDGYSYDSGAYDGYSYDSGAYDGYAYDSGSYDGYAYDSGSYDGGSFDTNYSEFNDSDSTYTDDNSAYDGGSSIDVDDSDAGESCGNGLCDFGETPQGCNKDCAGYGCKGKCGKPSADPGEVTCYCDVACAKSGDCCADFKLFCAP